MTLPLRLAVSCAVALVCIGLAVPQDRKEKNDSEEDARLNRIIERWIELNETERDHVAREVARAGADPKASDFLQWYTRLGGDEEEGWDRTRIQRKSVGEIFDRIAERIELRGPILSREQFVYYAKEHWRKGKSPRWRNVARFDTSAEAENLFRRLDRDRDGYLGDNEMAPALRGDLKRWDRNRDGWVNGVEYFSYFSYRLDRTYRAWQQRSSEPLPELEISPPEDERPLVTRAARLPIGLPAWFGQLDTDRDGQIGLYEWRIAGWSLEEFTKLDANTDGFLEASEVLKLLAVTERDGSRPFEYLLQKRTDAKMSK